LTGVEAIPNLDETIARSIAWLKIHVLL